jgi:Domain of unknown function (DUF2760)
LPLAPRCAPSSAENCKGQSDLWQASRPKHRAALLKIAFALAKGTSWCPMRLEPRLRFQERAIPKMKSYILIAAALITVLNALLLIPAMSAYTIPIAAFALLLAIAVLALSLFERRETPAPPPPPVVAKPPPPLPERHVEAEVVAFIGLLQEKGRLVDFLMDDVSLYDDSRVGAAARVVHFGCRDVLQEHFKVTPISDAEEGSQVMIPEDYSVDEYRLMGKITGNPPFKGVLLHKGWKTEFVKLPRLIKTGDKRLPSIAPALVEIK